MVLVQGKLRTPAKKTDPDALPLRARETVQKPHRGSHRGFNDAIIRAIFKIVHLPKQAARDECKNRGLRGYGNLTLPQLHERLMRDELQFQPTPGSLRENHHPEAGADSDAGTEADADAETGTYSDSEAGTYSDSEAGADFDSETDSDSDAGTDADSDFETETEAGSEFESKYFILCEFIKPHWVVKRSRLRDDMVSYSFDETIGTYEVDSACGKVLTNLRSDLDFNMLMVEVCGSGSLLDCTVRPKMEIHDESKSKIRDVWDFLKSELELEPEHELEIEAEPESQHERPEPQPEPEHEQREFVGAECPSKKRPFEKEVIPDSRDDDPRDDDPITPGQPGNKKRRISLNSMSTGGDYDHFAAATPLTTATTPSTTTAPADSDKRAALEQAQEIARKRAIELGVHAPVHTSTASGERAECAEEPNVENEDDDDEAVNDQVAVQTNNDGDAQPARWNPLDASMVAQVKSALHTSTAPGGEVRCREAEGNRIVGIIQTALESECGASMYVCGLPGTGKSLTVSEAEKVARSWGDGSKLGGGLRHACARADRPRVAAVNCMTLGNPQQVFARIIEELGVTPKSDSEAADESQSPEVRALRKFVTGDDKPMTVILLDEMDQLVKSKDQEILYKLFGLPTLNKSRCVVVGVANGINLVENDLPRLAQRGCKPVVVRFNAYKIDQLELLLRQRLGSLRWTVFEDAGLILCAKKVAAATGDMRRALNICAAAVDLCAREANEAAAKTEERDAASAESASLVKISHMARAISASFSSPVVDTMRGLPQHQQMVLCAAVRLFRNATQKEAALGVLNDKYTALCNEAGIRGLTPGEFSGICTVLADQTLLRLRDGPGREDRQRKTSLAVHENDVVFALQGVNFFRNLIGEKGSTSAGGGD